MLKKIMFFIPSLEYGGAERVTSYLASYFQKKNYEISLVTCKKNVSQEYTINESVQRYWCVNKKEISVAVKKVLPDLIVIMFAPMGILVVPAIRKYKIPYIISERNDPGNFAGKTTTKILYQHYMKGATGIVFQTHDAKKYYEGKIKGLQQIIYNPLSLNNFPDVFKGERRNAIVSVGRLHYQKNHKMLICAFAKVHEQYPELVLELYGDGVLRDELQHQIKNMHLEKYIFLKGTCDDILEKECDAMMFVITSNFEGMPNALIEAMALGLPVISTDCPCGGPREIIRHHENGSLIPVGDCNALEYEMLNLIQDSKLREKYSNEAIKIRDVLAETKIFQQWEEFCKLVVKEQG